MAGLAVTYTPSTTGRIIILVSLNMVNNTSGDGTQAQIRYGTGTAPANGAALTGTAVGSLLKSRASAASANTPATLVALVTGLAVGTQVWIDVSQAAITGGTASLTGIYILIMEL
jgi:hypothetical protein